MDPVAIQIPVRWSASPDPSKMFAQIACSLPRFRPKKSGILMFFGSASGGVTEQGWTHRKVPSAPRERPCSVGRRLWAVLWHPAECMEKLCEPLEKLCEVHATSLRRLLKRWGAGDAPQARPDPRCSPGPVRIQSLARWSAREDSSKSFSQIPGCLR